MTYTPTTPIVLPALQPLIHDEVVTLAAPTQAWSAHDGGIGSNAVHGYWTGDQRIVSEVRVEVAGSRIEPLALVSDRASEVTFTSLLRGLDGGGADPDVRMEHRREVEPGGVREALTVTNRRRDPVALDVTVRLVPDAASMDAVKSGAARVVATPSRADDGGAHWVSGSVSAVLTSDDAVVSVVGDSVVLRWHAMPAAGVPVSCAWRVEVVAPDAVVLAAGQPRPWDVPSARDERLARWLFRASDDLDALRLRRVGSDDEFFAAGAPWFFTLFGRDAIWAARFLVPVDTTMAASTLRVLADLQGAVRDPATAEQPGKIMHELRQGALAVDNAEITLPPLYYGTVDATPLWVCLLHDAWRAGMPRSEVVALLPAMVQALVWMRDYGDSDGDGLLEYVDESGRGLANQGWKDSGDSVQWRDGSRAIGPIALCEVQAYAHEAAMHGADLLDAFGWSGAEEWRRWAAALADRFRAAFWVRDEWGQFPAIALDASKQPVDSLTSNIGHLVGTGLLSGPEEALIAERLTSEHLASGFGLRTLATTAAGYWPLSYHGGSVWAHDTAIAIAGLHRSGFHTEAKQLAGELLAAAERFEYRMPELHSGDAVAAHSSPAPYPAACRPQAWSAAAAFAVWDALEGERNPR